ncbi:Hypothetical predicted protein [Cloeon dipterum]|uniref:Uncharacterized protein n=1 Tax=Cloeon dipterum TaxID=197152 RepID=A0A8S1CU08_9INSE|nr:Hypothetical predicted protein [Cloeon dipterum]
MLRSPPRCLRRRPIVRLPCPPSPGPSPSTPTSTPTPVLPRLRHQGCLTGDNRGTDPQRWSSGLALLVEPDGARTVSAPPTRHSSPSSGAPSWAVVAAPAIAKVAAPGMPPRRPLLCRPIAPACCPVAKVAAPLAYATPLAGKAYLG